MALRAVVNDQVLAIAGIHLTRWKDAGRPGAGMSTRRLRNAQRHAKLRLGPRTFCFYHRKDRCYRVAYTLPHGILVLGEGRNYSLAIDDAVKGCAEYTGQALE